MRYLRNVRITQDAQVVLKHLARAIEKIADALRGDVRIHAIAQGWRLGRDPHGTMARVAGAVVFATQRKQCRRSQGAGIRAQ